MSSTVYGYRCEPCVRFLRGPGLACCWWSWRYVLTRWPRLIAAGRNSFRAALSIDERPLATLTIVADAAFTDCGVRARLDARRGRTRRAAGPRGRQPRLRRAGCSTRLRRR